MCVKNRQGQRRLVQGPQTVMLAYDETLEALAARSLPDLPLEEAMDRIRGWNLHIFAMRKPRGLLLGGDVVFVEPPQS